MDPSEMIVAIVAIVCFTGLLKYAIRQKVAIRESSLGVNKELEDRLKRLEQRMANLETIVLDREKVREFERAL